VFKFLSRLFRLKEPEPRITHRQLYMRGACWESLKKFREVFGSSVEITYPNIEKFAPLFKVNELEYFALALLGDTRVFWSRDCEHEYSVLGVDNMLSEVDMPHSQAKIQFMKNILDCYCMRHAAKQQ
jgi:hypothetical protein